MIVIKVNSLSIVVLYFTTLQNVYCGVQEVMDNAVSSMQEIKEKVSQQKEIIANESQLIEVQSQVISASNQSRILVEHSAKLDLLQGDITGKDTFLIH